MSRVRLGFIGAGQFVSASHLPPARASAIMEILAIADVNPATLAKHKADLPASVKFTTDYRKILDDAEIDLVIIGTRQDLHARLIVESLDAGKWVYCEKPMAETDDEIAAVLAAEGRSTGKLAIGLNRRFAPSYARAKVLMQAVPRPWFVTYRLMAPHLTTGDKDDFYRNRPRIIYEGCHILDLLCWFFDADPQRVYMTGDRYRNNCCTFEFSDGSSAMLLCGSVGSFCYPKEAMEIFGHGHTIAINDFVDMQVRGFKNEFDELYPLDRGAHAENIRKFGMDYYDICRVKEIQFNPDSMSLILDAGMTIESVRRPAGNAAMRAIDAYNRLSAPYFDSPDKGRTQALEHFAQCILDGTQPLTADGRAGARSTEIGLALLASLEAHQSVVYSG